MGVGVREFQTYLCDACGREIISEKGAPVDGYYAEIVLRRGGSQIESDNIFACSDVCVEKAIRDSLRREALPEEQKLTETQELWLKGRQFLPNPALPVYDAGDETRLIGTAKEIQSYTPGGASHRQPDSLDPGWSSK